MYGTRDFGADIAFSGSTRPLPTWKHQQNPSGGFLAQYLNIILMCKCRLSFGKTYSENLITERVILRKPNSCRRKSGRTICGLV